MKFTLNDCLARINQVLNYPAVAYADVSHFFDQAIAELNTTLRIALPSVSEMRSEHTLDFTNHEGLVRLTTLPTSETEIPHYTTYEALVAADADGTGRYAYVCPANDSRLRSFYKWTGSAWAKVGSLLGVHLNTSGAIETFTAIPITNTDAVWSPVDSKSVTEFSLTDYMPVNWWILFVIPYVCFKFSVRNGDSGELFADEFTQGFQQLQTSYCVPSSVKLSSVAGMPAYTDIVKNNLHAIAHLEVPTRAIYENMRVPNGTASTFGGFYIDGGWV